MLPLMKILINHYTKKKRYFVKLLVLIFLFFKKNYFCYFTNFLKSKKGKITKFIFFKGISIMVKERIGLLR